MNSRTHCAKHTSIAPQHAQAMQLSPCMHTAAQYITSAVQKRGGYNRSCPIQSQVAHKENGQLTRFNTQRLLTCTTSGEEEAAVEEEERGRRTLSNTSVSQSITHGCTHTVDSLLTSQAVVSSSVRGS